MRSFGSYQFIPIWRLKGKLGISENISLIREMMVKVATTAWKRPWLIQISGFASFHILFDKPGFISFTTQFPLQSILSISAVPMIHFSNGSPWLFLRFKGYCITPPFLLSGLHGYSTECNGGSSSSICCQKASFVAQLKDSFVFWSQPYINIIPFFHC